MFKGILAVAALSSSMAFAGGTPGEFKTTCVLTNDTKIIDDVEVTLKRGQSMELYKKGDNVYSIDYDSGPNAQTQNPWGKEVVRLIQHNTKADTYVYAMTGADTLPKMFALVPGTDDVIITCQ